MPKQARPTVEKPKPAKKAKKETKPSKAQQALGELPYEIHASQRALCARLVTVGEHAVVVRGAHEEAREAVRREQGRREKQLLVRAALRRLRGEARGYRQVSDLGRPKSDGVELCT